MRQLFVDTLKLNLDVAGITFGKIRCYFTVCFNKNVEAPLNSD
uniref:Uncharacterized protein n=1 Tax=Rhizophora mucronata TaxID=61149 RepID=A0A2P2QE37_RHIMU